MASGCAANRQKIAREKSRAKRGTRSMNTLPPDHPTATKVLAKACTWADRRKAAQVAPPAQKPREVGRYEKSMDELSEAVEKYRKAGGQP